MTVTAAIDAQFLAADGTSTVPAILSYDPADPYQVEVAFIARSEEIAWVFARELLDTGLSHPAGHGDVRLWPAGPWHTALALDPPDGRALFLLPTHDVIDFLTRSYAAVPPGHEHLDLDAELEALLGGTR